MVKNRKAVFLIEEVLESYEKLSNSVFENYLNKEYFLKEGFEKLAEILEEEEVDKSAREELALKHDERFGSTICASHLIERGFVEGHQNYEYEWYLHIDYDQNKEEYLELFINRVLIDTVSLAPLVRDYADTEDLDTLPTTDPEEFVKKMDHDRYRELLGEILGDSDKRIQSILNKNPSPENGATNHQYISSLYGGVSEAELIEYALKTTVAADDYALIALDQKIDQVVEKLADNNQEKILKMLTGLGYLLNLYGIDFELTQTSCIVEF